MITLKEELKDTLKEYSNSFIIEFIFNYTNLFINENWNKIPGYDGNKHIGAIKPLLNNLGNSTLLSGTKNIQLVNRSYADKTKIYNGNGGKEFDAKSSFEITKVLDCRINFRTV